MSLWETAGVYSNDQTIRDQTSAKDRANTFPGRRLVASHKYQGASDGNLVEEKEQKDQSSSVRT